jgi:hypothetical protein
MVGLDQQGWITIIAGLLLPLITLFTSYSHVDIPGFGASASISKSDYLGSLPRWRRWLSTLNWRPVVEYEIREIEFSPLPGKMTSLPPRSIQPHCVNGPDQG